MRTRTRGDWFSSGTESSICTAHECKVKPSSRWWRRCSRSFALASPPCMKICFETSQKQIFSWFPPPLLPSSPLYSPLLPSSPLFSPLLPLSPLFSPCLPSTPLVSPLLPFQQVVEEMQPLVLSSFSSVPLLRSYPHSAQLRAPIVAQQQQEETALEHLRALRVAQQQVVEETALEHVRRVVGEMQQLKQQLDGMEEAAKALAESVAEQAKARMQQEEEEDDRRLLQTMDQTALERLLGYGREETGASGRQENDGGGSGK
ncbi:unnamed protein product [Closterium sp. Naga37s-1]|nr:unnamed protein product [Closterium sp. Naga37s-1]